MHPNWPDLPVVGPEEGISILLCFPEQPSPEQGLGASCGIGNCGLPEPDIRQAMPLEWLMGSPQEAIVRPGASKSSASKGNAPCQISNRLTLTSEANIAALTSSNSKLPAVCRTSHCNGQHNQIRGESKKKAGVSSISMITAVVDTNVLVRGAIASLQPPTEGLPAIRWLDLLRSP
jgi:hypothetical protein